MTYLHRLKMACSCHIERQPGFDSSLSYSISTVFSAYWELERQGGCTCQEGEEGQSEQGGDDQGG
ncbi:hypothetical protein K443DRAFT_491594 [Laccaria amethystina LaAM-08-1]|uniref:Uncharacterized protein n=1 Tax=Laccaria amethystina LaAM-08-1 TaxID=1095629 RepID=A0A0C9XZD4_9AGAR|nr:hypothetical protein K443DRAFT_491594 [Laccaria amethystina LaAM-08-1]